MKILVTGYKGFIGGNAYRTLLNLGYEVDGYDYSNVYPTIKNYDWIMHIGGISSTTERDVNKIMLQNYDFSIDLYEKAKQFGVNFQFSSSASVYGLNNEFKETSPVDPRTPYAWSKYMFERYIANHPPTNSIVQAFRYFNVYGPEGEEHKGDQASPYQKFKSQAESLGEISVFENSEQYLRDFIQVNEVIQTQIRFFDVKESGVWNLGTGTTKSFLDVAKSFNVPIKTVPMPDNLKQSYQKYTCADVQKLTKTLDNIER